MSKKRKSPDDQDFEDYPPAGTSDQGRSDGHKYVKVELLSECSYVSSSGIRWCISLHSDIQTDHYK